MSRSFTIRVLNLGLNGGPRLENNWCHIKGNLLLLNEVTYWTNNWDLGTTSNRSIPYSCPECTIITQVKLSFGRFVRREFERLDINVPYDWEDKRWWVYVLNPKELLTRWFRFSSLYDLLFRLYSEVVSNQREQKFKIHK